MIKTLMPGPKTDPINTPLAPAIVPVEAAAEPIELGIESSAPGAELAEMDSQASLAQAAETKPTIVADQPDFWVVNKPIGWTVQRDEQAPSVLQWLEETYGAKVYPVHRLDKPTSGLLLVAKTTVGNRALSQAFAERGVEKTYLALSDKKPLKKQGWVKGDMAVSRRSQWKLLRTLVNPAVTQFTSTLLANGLRGFILHPKTGKTHQLRVALKSLGCPILGDSLYAGSASDRVYLHAWKIAFQFQDTQYQYQIDPTDGLFSDWQPEPS
jgi:tRNA pseudouridine32 synthase/23S rRNA pseudouridine746 synthase